MAEKCFEKMVSGIGITAGSAGLYAFDGEAMSENSLQALAEAGIDGSSFRSRSLTHDLVCSSKLILTMTMSHRAELLMRYPEAEEKCFTLLPGDVSDPYGQNLDVYRRTLTEIRKGLEKWLEIIKNSK